VLQSWNNAVRHLFGFRMYVRHIFEVEDRQRVCVEDEEEAGCQREIGFDATFVFPISKISESQLISGESFKGDSEGWDEYEMPNINHITPESPSRDVLLNSYWPQITEKSRFCSLGVIYVSRYPEQHQLSHVCQVVLHIDVKDKLFQAIPMLQLSNHPSYFSLCQPSKLNDWFHNILESCQNVIDTLGTTRNETTHIRRTSFAFNDI
jgi:hypothetical protein